MAEKKSNKKSGSFSAKGLQTRPDAPMPNLRRGRQEQAANATESEPPPEAGQEQTAPGETEREPGIQKPGTEAQRPEQAGPPGSAPMSAAERPTPSSPERPAPSEAAPGIAPSYEPEKMEEARKADELRREKAAAKKTARTDIGAGEKPKKSVAGGGAPESDGRGLISRIGFRGSAPAGEGEAGDVADQLKKLAKRLAQIISALAPATCCNPCCWWFVFMLLIVLIILNFVGLL
ncbi:MAG: hypothetical protein ACOZBH_03580 [Patescibacteria group bacterium]